MFRCRRRVWPSFAGFRFPSDPILPAVRWYLRYGLSYRDIEELRAEQGIDVDHATIHRRGRGVVQVDGQLQHVLVPLSFALCLGLRWPSVRACRCP